MSPNAIKPSPGQNRLSAVAQSMVFVQHSCLIAFQSPSSRL
jgi:hypothetical protein